MIYLDNAATSYPKPPEVYDEVMSCMKNYAANPGRSSHNMAIIASSKIIECRERLSKLFNISDPFGIVFTSNATQAINIGIKGILKRGDHVISTIIEHNSVLRPLNSLYKEGVKITLLGVNQYGYINIDDLKKEIGKKTKLIVINHSSNVLGTVQNIRSIGDIARERGITFMIDASQSAGVIPIDVEKDKIDLLAFPGHKSLYGPQGTGGLYIRKGIVLNTIIEGGTGSNSNSMNQPDFLPDRLESGTLNTPGIAGLCEGIKFIEKEGINNIEKKEETMTEYLMEELKKMDYVKIYGLPTAKGRCSVVSINIDEIDCSKVGYMLNKKNIAVRTGYHCAPLIHGIIGTNNSGTVRISPGYFNTTEDIEYFIEVIDDIYKNRNVD